MFTLVDLLYDHSVCVGCMYAIKWVCSLPCIQWHLLLHFCREDHFWTLLHTSDRQCLIHYFSSSVLLGGDARRAQCLIQIISLDILCVSFRVYFLIQLQCLPPFPLPPPTTTTINHYLHILQWLHILNVFQYVSWPGQCLSVLSPLSDICCCISAGKTTSGLYYTLLIDMLDSLLLLLISGWYSLAWRTMLAISFVDDDACSFTSL